MRKVTKKIKKIKNPNFNKYKTRKLNKIKASKIIKQSGGFKRKPKGGSESKKGKDKGKKGNGENKKSVEKSNSLAKKANKIQYDGKLNSAEKKLNLYKKALEACKNCNETKRGDIEEKIGEAETKLGEAQANKDAEEAKKKSEKTAAKESKSRNAGIKRAFTKIQSSRYQGLNGNSIKYPKPKPKLKPKKSREVNSKPEQPQGKKKSSLLSLAFPTVGKAWDKMNQEFKKIDDKYKLLKEKPTPTGEAKEKLDEVTKERESMERQMNGYLAKTIEQKKDFLQSKLNNQKNQEETSAYIKEQQKIIEAEIKKYEAEGIKLDSGVEKQLEGIKKLGSKFSNVAKQNGNKGSAIMF